MSLARTFMDALATLERERDLGPIVSLFADEAHVGNVVHEDAFLGAAGARHFWKAYRAQFGEVRSEFRNVVESDGCVVLEWSSRGTTAAGAPFEYSGVSVLEHDGARVRRFHAYFDPRMLGRQVERGLRSAAASFA